MLIQNTRIFSIFSGRSFSKKILELPVIDVSSVKNSNGSPDLEECRRLVESLRKFGALAIRDPFVNESKNQEFLSLMEEYFASRSEKYYRGEELDEAFPETGYQVGVTPELKEIARTHSQKVSCLPSTERPVTPQPPPRDGKWRFFWRIGEIDEMESRILPPQVIPKDFPEWETKMDNWGNLVNLY